MSKTKATLLEAVLARMSLGAVPMDGLYWFDPNALRERAQKSAASAQAGQDSSGQETLHECRSN